MVMINPMLRRTAFVAAAVAMLSLTASAQEDNALSSALGAMQARFAALAHLKAQSQVPALAQVQFQAAQTRTEPIILSCRYDNSDASFTLRVNYATGLLEQLAPSGNAYSNRVVTATISANAIVWSKEFLDDGTNPPSMYHWEGNIDRLSGTGSIVAYRPDYNPYAAYPVTCRRGAPQF